MKINKEKEVLTQSHRDHKGQQEMLFWSAVTVSLLKICIITPA